ncbi:TetR/AcrR family transcriptional regulator [Paenibacillus lemnae]|uniref:TetR/AcrR family transcriptional regulator n=1 Tax=Paenibacillus lemnae TaxID=1330551 RepID=A0A848M6E6_PAELE|nr:TetR/AcrR family transcriptional regulator [Paenibacillus lemnae]
MSAKSNTKDVIINTAARLFFSQGYHATGLNQIVQESKAPKGSLYHYFPGGKEELALVCIELANVQILQAFQCTFDKHDNTGDAIRQFIVDLASEAEAAGFTGFLPFSFWAAVETSCISLELRTACQRVFSNWQDAIKQQLVVEGVPLTVAAETALLVISLMEGALIISLTNQSKEPLLTAADYLSVVIKQSLGGK